MRLWHFWSQEQLRLSVVLQRQETKKSWIFGMGMKCLGEEAQEQELLDWQYKYMGDWSAEDLAQPELIEAPGIQDIKWKEIFDKWGPLICDEKQKEWKYLSEDPGEARRNKVRDHTKESKRQRRERSITKGPGAENV
jgi:hypothetical protein